MHSHKGHSPAESVQKPRLELAQVFNRYWQHYQVHHKTSYHQDKVVRAIQACRTEKLGGHIESCTNRDCDYETQAYNSCRNRNCTKCQYSKQLEWVYNRLMELLPLPYFHHVFTLPHILNNLALCNKEVLYGLFFQSCNFTLNAFSKDPRFLQAKLGFIGVLQTWGQKLDYHIHIHFIIPGGGITEDGRRFKRLPYQEKFLFPVKAMSRTIRARFVKLLKKAYQQGLLCFPGSLAAIKSPEAFERFCQQVGRQEWVNYTKKPFAGPEQVLQYIARYTHRVAISNQRLLDIENGKVTFSYKDYKDKDKKGIAKIKEMTLTAEQFIQRFLWHLVPSGFKKIRHGGFLSPGLRGTQLALARSLLKVANEQALEVTSGIKAWLEKFEPLLKRICPKCGIGTLVYQLVPVYDSS